MTYQSIIARVFFIVLVLSLSIGCGGGYDRGGHGFYAAGHRSLDLNIPIDWGSPDTVERFGGEGVRAAMKAAESYLNRLGLPARAITSRQKIEAIEVGIEAGTKRAREEGREISPEAVRRLRMSLGEAIDYASGKKSNQNVQGLLCC